jgi:flagellar motor component MotA
MREVMMEGVLGIQSGLNPHLLEQKLRSYFSSTGAVKGYGY